MKQTDFAFRSIALACALGAASLPALAQGARQQGDPARWYSPNTTQQQTVATIKKEVKAAYAEQKRECQRQAKGERAACLEQARQTYREDMANAPQLAAAATTPTVVERMVVTVEQIDASAGSADSAVGGSQGGATGSGGMEGGAQDGSAASGGSGTGITASGTSDASATATGTPTGDMGVGATDPASGQTQPMEPQPMQPPPVATPPRSTDTPIQQ